MPGIKVLPAEVAQKIAAGEVVERPVSVVKELVENSLDAMATEIKVELLDGGKKLIRVQDNGCGLSQEDTALCFRRHATSKIEKEEDLGKVATLGFRGEALASISAVSRLTLKTFDGSGEKGYQVEREGDKLIRFLETAFPKGTLVEVRDLFFNLPARRKFLRSERSELSLVVNYLTQAALAFPEVKFSLSHNSREIINCPAVSSLKERVYQLYGKKLLDNLMPVDYEEDGYRIFGLSSRPFSGRFDRQHQLVYVNRRPVKDRMLLAALGQAYLGLLEKQKNPEGFLFLRVPYEQVDVNVHPTKAEVRFKEPQQVYRLILRAVEIAARQESLVKPIIVEEKSEKERERESSGEANLGENQVSLGLGKAELSAARTIGNFPEQKIKGISENLSESQKPVQVLGQYLNSYIVVASEDGLFIIDQHNAHERILFEKFEQLDKNRSWAAKQMLFPSVLELSPGQRLALEELQAELEAVGFRLEPMGGNSVALREFPDVFQEKEASEILLSVLEKTGSDKFKDKRTRMLATMACKAAVKAGQLLTRPEMEFLAQELFQAEYPGVCPHGRPVVIRIDRSKIERTLGRQTE
jgi:DNA mismatch repair protein MutL